MDVAELDLTAFLEGYLEKVAFWGSVLSVGKGSLARKATKGIGEHIAYDKAKQAIKEHKSEKEPEKEQIRDRIFRLDPAMYRRLEEAGLLDDVSSALG